MYSFTYTDIWDEPVSISLLRSAYAYGGGLALILVNTDRERDDFGEEVAVLSVNLPGDPLAEYWTEQDECDFILDTNNVPADVIARLIADGVIEYGEGCVMSGFCSYPFARLTEKGVREVEDYDGFFDSLRHPAAA